jgi:predicted DNA-binding transcriptional regulator AlpA
MSRSTDDVDQPGLWPLAETPTIEKTPRTTTVPKEGTAAVTKPRSDTPSPLPQRATAASEHPATSNEAPHLWDIDEVSHYLAVSRNTIYGWRKTNYGPPAIRIGKHLRWLPERVIAWAAAAQEE